MPRRARAGSSFLATTVAILGLSSCSSHRAPAPSAPAAAAPSAATPGAATAVSDEFEVLADCRYTASVGWGNCFRCTVRDRVRGSWNEAEVVPCVGIGSMAPPGGQLGESRDAAGLLLTFRRDHTRRHGPPSGFRSPADGYFELTATRSADATTTNPPDAAPTLWYGSVLPFPGARLVCTGHAVLRPTLPRDRGKPGRVRDWQTYATLASRDEVEAFYKARGGLPEYPLSLQLHEARPGGYPTCVVKVRAEDKTVIEVGKWSIER